MSEPNVKLVLKSLLSMLPASASPLATPGAQRIVLTQALEQQRVIGQYLSVDIETRHALIEWIDDGQRCQLYI
jgi:hypothetical protein